MDQTSDGKPKRKCQFVVLKKNRPCRMWALEGERFCGEHTVHDTGNLSALNSVPEDRVRIKCPLDPRHTCFLKKLDRHLKVCNAREKERPPYYVRDINAGDAVLQLEGKTIHELSDRALLDLLDRIRALHADHVPPQEVAEDAAHVALAESLENRALGPDTLKHLRQNSALLGVLRDAALLDGERTFVELGSGKAQLSFWLARAVSSRSQIVLVDFASHRHKAENKLKDLADMPTVERLKIDIRHLSLAGCDACQGRPVIAISKHLCGAATDLGIRAATAAMDSRTPADNRPRPFTPPAGGTDRSVKSEPAAAAGPPPAGATEPPPAGGPESSPGGVDVQGVLIAVCCHHRVDWASYVGKQFLQEECGFSGADFTALKGVAAWATCGTPSWDMDSLHRSGRDSLRRQSIREKRGRTAAAAADAGAADGTAADETARSVPGDQTESGQLTADHTEVPAVTGSPATEPSPVAAAVERIAADGAAGDEPQKRPGAADEHDNSKRARLNGLGEAADEPGPGSREASAGRYQRLGLTPEQRTAAGFMCKRLLDEGRRRYLEQRGFTARMVRYVPASVSPENVLLLATR